MKKLLYVLTGLCLLAVLFVGCEKPNETNESGGTIPGGTTPGGTIPSDTIPGGTTTEKFASIQGKVTDKKTGEPLSDVTIILQPYSKRVHTEEDGIYRFDSLKIRAYILSALKEGYVDYTKEDVQPIADQILQLNIEMEETADPIIPEDYMETAFNISMDMVYVEGGTFEMGATAEQGPNAYDAERPVHIVTLDGYHIGKYEVTQWQWSIVMGKDPSYHHHDYFLPVERVSWNDAQEFCRRLSEATGKKYVLPTEAQWEYAARGGNKSQHYIYAGSNDPFEVGWILRGGDPTINLHTYPVGTKKPNELGIYDMSGNVTEWCSDWYGPYSGSPAVNPQGPSTGKYRVTRGGSFQRTAFPDCRVSCRPFYMPSDERSMEVGFRVACVQ